MELKASTACSLSAIISQANVLDMQPELFDNLVYVIQLLEIKGILVTLSMHSMRNSGEQKAGLRQI